MEKRIMQVDIILPIYNANSFVFDAIDSILLQTYTNWHLIIIDDCSNDNMLDLIKKKYEKYNHKITYFELFENNRAAGARNYAIGKTDGELIAFIDQDDVWLPQKLEKQINCFAKINNIGALHSNIDFIDENGKLNNINALLEISVRESIRWLEKDKTELAKFIFMNSPIRLVSSIIKREAFEKAGGFDDTLFGGEDWEFWVRYAINFRIGYINEILVHKRHHLNNTSIVFLNERINGLLQAVNKMKKRYEFLKDIAPKKEKQIMKSKIKTLIDHRRYGETIKFVTKLFIKYPFDMELYKKIFGFMN